MTLQAIDTVYRGYKFRSRLEARWAVFFDTLGVDYDYEPEGFNLGGEAGYYLPDFWLPRLQLWIEIKPSNPSHEEMVKAQRLAEQSGYHVAILHGKISTPDVEYFEGYEFNVSSSTYSTMLFYGNVDTRFEPYTFGMRFDTLPAWLREQGADAEDWDGTIEHARRLQLLNLQVVEASETDFIFADRHRYGIRTEGLIWRYESGQYLLNPPSPGTWGWLYGNLPRAYSAAQQARFEHENR